MEKSKNSGLDSFRGFNIESIEQDLGIILPESGESGKGTAQEDGKGKEEKKTTKPLLDLSNKIMVPETEEERLQLEKSGNMLVNKDDEDGSVGEGEGKEEKKKKEDEGKTGEEEDVEITEDSPLYLHAATLSEEGILPTLDLNEIKGKKFSEALKIYLDASKRYIDEGRNEYRNSLTERQREFLDMIEKGIPQENVEHQFSVEDAYGKITDEALADNTELQEQLIIQNLRVKGFKEPKIKNYIESVKEKERLFEEAKDAKDDINAYIASQKEEMIREAEEEERKAVEKEKELEKTIKNTIESTNEIFPGIKISAAEKTELYNLMTKPVEIRNVDGQKVPVSIINKEREADPVNFNLRLVYYIRQGLFKKDFDLTKLSKKITSSAASTIARKLKEEVGGLAGKGVTVQKKKEEENKKPTIILPSF